MNTKNNKKGGRQMRRLCLISIMVLLLAGCNKAEATEVSTPEIESTTEQITTVETTEAVTEKETTEETTNSEAVTEETQTETEVVTVQETTEAVTEETQPVATENSEAATETTQAEETTAVQTELLSTEVVTQVETTTQAPTEPVTQATEAPVVTEAETQPETTTQAQTEPVTQAPTQAPVETQPVTEAPTEHTHNYNGNVTSNASCTTDGVKTYTCGCGASYTETIAAFGHNYGNYAYNNDATYEADGTETRTCSSCGNIDTRTASGTKLVQETQSATEESTHVSEETTTDEFYEELSEFSGQMYTITYFERAREYSFNYYEGDDITDLTNQLNQIAESLKQENPGCIIANSNNYIGKFKGGTVYSKGIQMVDSLDDL